MANYSDKTIPELKELLKKAEEWLEQMKSDKTIPGIQQRALGMQRYVHIQQVLAVKEAISDVQEITKKGAAHV